MTSRASWRICAVGNNMTYLTNYPYARVFERPDGLYDFVVYDHNGVTHSILVKEICEGFNEPPLFPERQPGDVSHVRFR